jgi:hypothetical protein
VWAQAVLLPDPISNNNLAELAGVKSDLQYLSFTSSITIIGDSHLVIQYPENYIQYCKT